MSNVLVIELRGDVVPEDLSAPLSEDELQALERSIARFRDGEFGVRTDTAEPVPDPGVMYYRKASDTQ